MKRVGLFALMIATAAPGVAAAQEEVGRGEAVASRARPDFDPLGIRLGSFILSPAVGVQETYNTNVLYSAGGTQGDWLTEVRPSVDLRSDWGSHSLGFHADGDILRYSKFHQLGYDAYAFRSDGKLDIQRDARLYGRIGYSHQYEPLYWQNNVLGQTAPASFNDLSAGLSGEKEFNRLILRVDGNYDRYQWDNIRLPNGSFLRESSQNSDEKQVSLHTGYEVGPLRQVYLLTSYDWRNYEFKRDLGGFNRDSTGYTIELGVQYDLTGILFADLAVGYLRQDYRDARLHPTTGPTGAATITWNITQLTTLSGNMTRRVWESFSANSSSYLATVEGIRADHELLRDLLLNLAATHETDDFVGTTRNDEIFNLGVGAKYLVNRNLWIEPGYTRQFRQSTLAGVSFHAHIFTIGFNIHL